MSLSVVVESALESAIVEAELARRERAAIDYNNAFVARYGVFGDEFRQLDC